MVKISLKLHVNFHYLDEELVAFLKLHSFSLYIAKFSIQISYNKMASLTKLISLNRFVRSFYSHIPVIHFTGLLSNKQV